MSANLTPQYRKAEKAYRQASGPEEELECLQLMLREIPKHKGTDRLQADLKQKISKLKKEQSKAKPGGQKASRRIPRQGAGRAVLLGPPNSGKSQLLRSLSRAKPDVADYPFSTSSPMPGMMSFEDIHVQLVDTPPVTSDFLDPTTQGLVRGADLVLLLVDLASDDCAEDTGAVIRRLEQTRTGLATSSYLDEGDVGRSYTRTIVVLNKCDVPGAEDRRQWFNEVCPLDFPQLVISAREQTGLEELREAVFQALDVVRIYTKMPHAREPDYDKPFTIARGGTLQQVAELIHKDVASNLKHARVWGSQVHDGTSVKGDYVLADRDVVEIHV